MKYCPECGTSLTGKESFCPECGGELDGVGSEKVDSEGTTEEEKDLHVSSSQKGGGQKKDFGYATVIMLLVFLWALQFWWATTELLAFVLALSVAIPTLIVSYVVIRLIRLIQEETQGQERHSERGPQHRLRQSDSGSILAGGVWIFIIQLLLIWLPVVGSLIAGYVGGKKSGSVIGGVIAAIIVPLIMVPLIQFIPVVGQILGGVVVIAYLLFAIFIFIGVIIGGAAAN